VIELFAVPEAEEDAFRAAFAEHAPPGAVLYRALRGDVPHRFASVTDGPLRGVLLITQASANLDQFTGRQGFLGARVDGGLAAVHWSSPLMYARTGVSLPGAVYAPVSAP
jgi:hypothetical protein